MWMFAVQVGRHEFTAQLVWNLMTKVRVRGQKTKTAKDWEKWWRENPVGSGKRGRTLAGVCIIKVCKRGAVTWPPLLVGRQVTRLWLS